jgi:hypothetical protein
MSIQTSAQSSKDLILASQHMEKSVLTPLQELGRRIRYKVDVLQDSYIAQLELLDGEAPGAASGSSSGTGTGSSTSGFSAGAGFGQSKPSKQLNSSASASASASTTGASGSVKSQLGDLTLRQEGLSERIAAIQSRFAEQRERVAAVLSGALRTKTRVSYAITLLLRTNQ